MKATDRNNQGEMQPWSAQATLVLATLAVAAMTLLWLSYPTRKPYEKAHDIGVEQDALMAVHQALIETIGINGIVPRIGDSSVLNLFPKIDPWARSDEAISYIRANREKFRVPPQIQNRRIDQLAPSEPLVVFTGSRTHYVGVAVDGSLIKAK